MDHMNIDQVYDIPDTPDRLATQNLSVKGRMEKKIDSSGASHSGNTDVFCEAPRNQPRGRNNQIIDNGLPRRLPFYPEKGPSISNKSEGDEGFTLSLTNSSSSRNAHLFRKTMVDRTANCGNRYSLNSQHKGKGIAQRTSQSSPSGENAVVDLTELNGHAQVSDMAFPKEFRKGPVSTNGLSLIPGTVKASMAAPIIHKGKEKIDDTHKGISGNDTHKGISGVNHAKGNIGHCQPKAGNIMSASFRAIPPPRVSGQKRLVRNGCISPYNIAKAKHLAANHSNGSINVQNDVESVVSDCSSDLIRELISEENNSHRVKGSKSHLSLSKEADVKTIPTRQFMAHSNLTEKVLPPFSAGDQHLYSTKDEPRIVSQQNQNRMVRKDNRSGSMTSESSLIKRYKQGSSSSNHGERSSFASVDSDIVVLGSPGEPSNLRSTKSENSRGLGTLNPVIEIDEFSPDIRCVDSSNSGGSSNDDSYARARQLEADEMLARELQEQLYNETSEVGDAEEEETSQQAFAGMSHPVFRPRGSVSSNSYRRSQSRLSQNPSTRTSTQARGPTSSRLTRLRSRFPSQLTRIPVGQRSSVFPSNMDLDMRIHILEALEAFSDMEMASNIQADRDFNENDYEMLLRLDENNHQHGGASLHVINSLPQSTVQGDNAEDCAICLETPTMGDTIRHLPCLHKFHKDCIDPWLRRRTSCPVCKSSVT